MRVKKMQCPRCEDSELTLNKKGRELCEKGELFTMFVTS